MTGIVGYTGSLKTVIDTNATNAKNRANHTGTQTADTITDGTTNKAYTAAEKTKLAAVSGTNTGDQTLALNGSVLTISGGTGNSVTIPTSGGATVTDATTSAKGIVQLAGDLAGTAAAPTLANTSAARANLGLGSAATQPASAFDAAGAAAAVTPSTLGIGNAVTLGGTVNAITGNATAVIGVRNTVDATAGAVTVTLPTPTRVGQSLIIERLDTSATNAITISGTIRGVGSSTAVLPAVGVANEGGLWVAESLTSWVPGASIKPKAWLDAVYAPKPTGTAAAGKYVDGGTNAWTTLPAGGGSTIPSRGRIIPSVGDYFTLKGAGGVSLTPPSDGTLRIHPIPLPTATYDQVSIQVSTAGSTGALAKVVGYWGNSWQAGDAPVNLAFETAWIDAGTGGTKSITIPTPFVVSTSSNPLYFGVALSGTLTTVPQFSGWDINGLWGNEASTNAILWYAELTTGWQAGGYTAAAPSTLPTPTRINSGAALWAYFRRSA